MLKKLNLIMIVSLFTVGVNTSAFAYDDYEEEEIVEESVSDVDLADKISSDALLNYNESGSLFEKITVLEQEKVVVQLEKERAQLDLDLERLNAEKIKLQMELDTLSGRAEQQQHELEAAKTQLDIQTETLKRQMAALDEEPVSAPVAKASEKKVETNVSKKYKLINVVGMGNQLQATIEDITTGQNKRIAVGKELDGYIVKSISLNDGIVFEKDGETESLNIGK
jgi:type IV pilus biogenesis protein PilP